MTDPQSRDWTRPTTPPRTPLSAIAELVASPGVAAAGSEPVVVTGLSLSSQRIRPGDLYAALPGARVHGADFAAEAIDAGAVAVLTDPAGHAVAASCGVPVLVVEDPRAHLGALGALIYGFPARRLTLIAVTGTQGKTTTTRLLESGLSAAGIPAAVVGTVGTRIAGHDVKTALTTPEAPDLHALFAVMVEEGVRVCAMEVSSHALVKGRVDGVVFDVAAFTNLGRDHLDFHRDLEDYFAAKASLFTPERARRGVVNGEDEHGRRLLAESTIPSTSFSVSGAEADWQAQDVVTTATGGSYLLHPPTGPDVSGTVPLPGAFNIANAVCAVAAAGEAGMDPAVVAAGIGRGPGVPGRLELVPSDRGFTVVVDYAHKPDAVEATIEALRSVTRGRVLVVIGAGGDRDTGKRPLMGEIAARLADVLVVTDDNPRTEDPATIRAEVLAGVRDEAGAVRAEIHEQGDRRAAIGLALSLARAGDVVLVAGKGHETGQEIDGVVHPFDDRAVVRELLEEGNAG